jgi:hypothetical protein
MIPGRIRKAVLLAAIPVSFVLLAAAYLFYAPRGVPQGQAALVHLDAASLAGLRDDFNAASGATHLLVLLSPT